MAYSVSYGNRIEVMAVSLQMATDAHAQAIEWIRAGRQNVVITDLETGKKRDAIDILLAQEQTSDPRQPGYRGKQLG